METIALGINDAGRVVGYSNMLIGGGAAALQPVIWENGQPTVLPLLVGGNGGNAWAINNSNLVVGSSFGTIAGVFGRYAVSWTNGLPSALPRPVGAALGVFPDDEARAVSASGAFVAGTSATGCCSRRAAIWENGTGVVLAPVASGPSAQDEALGVNDQGTVVGRAAGTVAGQSFAERAVVWKDGTATLLPLLSGGARGRAHAITNSGIIAGYAEGVVGGVLRGFAVTWSADGTLTPLPMPAGAVNSGAAAITENGDVAGWGTFSDGGSFYEHAVLWSAGVAYDLGLLPGSFRSSAFGLNSSATVVGTDFGPSPAIWVPPTSTGTGTNIAVTPVDPTTGATPVTLTFASITAPGTTTVTTSGTGAPPPLAFKMGNPPVYYELKTTATFSGAITVCFGYTPGAFSNPGNLRLLHGGTGGGWTDVTTINIVDGTASRICGSVTSLSPFILAELHYDFVGFFQPVDNPGPNFNVINTVKAGAAVPVKFSLGGNMGLNVFQSSAPYSSGRPCVNGMESAVEETVTAGASGLTYDATSGQYTYVWKTDKTWAGMCRTLTVAFKDGTVRGALFRLTK